MLLALSSRRPSARRLPVAPLSPHQLFALVHLYLREPYESRMHPPADGHVQKTYEALVRKGFARRWPGSMFSITDAGSARIRAALGGGQPTETP